MKTIIIFILSLFVLVAIGCTEAELQQLSLALDEVNKSLEQQRLERESEQEYRPSPPIPPVPQYRPPVETRKPDVEERYAYMIKDAVTPTHPKVRTFALRLAREFPGNYNIGQVCAIWYYVKGKWGYVNDPRGIEYIAPAHESIEAGLSGDCDDFAVLLASLIETIGGTSRVVLAQGPQGGHAYCEVFMGHDPQHAQQVIQNVSQIDTYRDFLGGLARMLRGGQYVFHYHGDEGYWLNLDWSADHPGGPFFPSYSEIAVYSNGRWKRIR